MRLHGYTQKVQMKEDHSIGFHITDTYTYLYKTVILLVLQTQDHQTTSQAFQKKIDFLNLVVLLHFFS